jgi:hypothetical protein
MPIAMPPPTSKPSDRFAAQVVTNTVRAAVFAVIGAIGGFIYGRAAYNPNVGGPVPVAVDPGKDGFVRDRDGRLLQFPKSSLPSVTGKYTLLTSYEANELLRALHQERMQQWTASQGMLTGTPPPQLQTFDETKFRMIRLSDGRTQWLNAPWVTIPAGSYEAVPFSEGAAAVEASVQKEVRAHAERVESDRWGAVGVGAMLGVLASLLVTAWVLLRWLIDRTGDVWDVAVGQKTSRGRQDAAASSGPEPPKGT